MTFLLIATNKYIQYVDQCVNSIKKYVPDALIYTFSDSHPETDFKIEHQPWPYITLHRFHYFLKVKDLIIGDKIFYVDVDAKFVSKPTEAIKGGNLIATRHCGYWFEGSKDLPNETNRGSVFFQYKFQKYYGGGFFGGSREEFFKLCEWCKMGIDADLNNGIIPRHNDETAMNAYFSINPPTTELTPSYHYPGDSEYMKKEVWKGRDMKPVLWLLEKNHEIVRA